MTSPPHAAVVPEPITTVVTALSAVLVVVGLVWSLRILRRERDPYPLLLGVGGAIASVLEPFFDVTGAIWHPIAGQWTAFTLFERHIPMFIPLGWCWNVGFGCAVLYRLMVSGRIHTANYWRWVGVAVGLNVLFEAPGTALGVYLYYGDQPLPLTSGKYPLPIAVANGVASITVAVAALRLRSVVRGGPRLWLLGWLITPLGFWIGAGPGWFPQMVAVGSESLPHWAVPVLGAVSILLSLAFASVLRDIMSARPALAAGSR